MTHSNEIPFLTGAPFAPVVRFALPVAATGILQLLFNAADIIVVGRFAGNDCLAAVGATTSLISLLISAFMGVSVGVNILTARLLGSGQTEQAAAAAQRLSNLNPLCVRAEDPSMARYKRSFSIGTSRAVAKLSILAELVLPYIQVGGTLIALKGSSGKAEVGEARSAIQTLGGEISEICEKILCFGDTSESRSIIVVQKMKDSPIQYPRQFAAILKKPL